MKISLIKPDGDKLQFDADFWEFSQNKFEDEDIVLIFYKSDLSRGEIEQGESIPVSLKKPSKQGIIKDLEEFTTPLVDVIGKEKLETLRKENNITFSPPEESFSSSTKEDIATRVVMIGTSLDSSVDDLLLKERGIYEKNRIQIIEEPLVYVGRDTFYIKETIRVERSKEIKNEEK